MTDTKKYQGTFCGGSIMGVPFKKYNTDIERYALISDYFSKMIEGYASVHSQNLHSLKVMIEGYAMGAKGQVFNIAENTGIMKYRLFQSGITLSIISPKSVKKFATGSGNSDKQAMYDAFLAETKLDLRKELQYDKKDISSPIGDIVDSYYICKMLTIP